MHPSDPRPKQIRLASLRGGQRLPGHSGPSTQAVEVRVWSTTIFAARVSVPSPDQSVPVALPGSAASTAMQAAIAP
jgi:hypothetical protein